MSLEIEYKYLIERPTTKTLSDLKVEMQGDILQTYLTPIGNIERRLRRISKNNTYRYFYTEKTVINDLVREENELEIDKIDYDMFLYEKDPTRSPLNKIRYIFKYNNHKFELDFYQCDDRYLILEVELNNEHEVVELPPNITVVKNVTGDKNFSNYMLAKTCQFPL